jgi:hypothetical protein
MHYSKNIAIALAAVVCSTLLVTDAAAQSRGRSGGGRSGSGRGPSVGRAVPRGGGGGGARVQSPRGDRGRSYGSSRVISPRVIVRAPLRSYYYPYYAYRPGLSIGLYGRFGYPYYGYGYGYPYAYGYSYGGYYPYGYGGYGYGYGSYGYGSYGYGSYGSGSYRGDLYGGVRIQGAARGAQVYVDGYYAGIVDDFDGTFQRLSLEEGPHEIELRAPGLPPLTYDVNVQPGQTVTIHANVR